MRISDWSSDVCSSDLALFLSAVLVLSIVAGLGGGMILVLLDTSFSSLTELRDYTGLRVLGAISDARSRAGRRLAEAAMLVVGFAGLAGILVMLLLIERQYGLDTVLAADFTRGSLGNGADAVAQASREVLTALRDRPLS